jgi:hypothetical protein
MNTFLAAFLIAALAGLGGYYLHEVIEPRFEVAAVGNGGAIRVESRSGNTWRLIVHDGNGQRVEPFWHPIKNSQ